MFIQYLPNIATDVQEFRNAGRDDDSNNADDLILLSFSFRRRTVLRCNSKHIILPIQLNTIPTN